MFSGSIVALITPMNKDGSINYTVFTELLHWHMQNGTNGVVIAGTTGESPTLHHNEWRKLLEIAVAEVNQKIPVIAGTGCNSTESTVEKTREAMTLGVDGCLVVTPYYNRPTQEGLYQHYRTVSEAVPVPIILYNVPTRTGCDLLPATVKRLKHASNIVAIKEAPRDKSRYQEIMDECGNQLTLLTGDDGTSLECFAVGGRGNISAVANVAPAKVAAVCAAALADDIAKATEINESLRELNSVLFVEPNPIAVKWALYEMGKIPEGIRLPLTPLSDQYHDAVRKALQG
jgi:4-hydroxy-tetrahydrodipicolinate synthase